MKRFSILTLFVVCFAAPALAQQSIQAGGGEVTVSRTGQTTIKSRSDKSVNVTSNVSVTGSVTASGNVTATGNVAAGGTLAATGATTLSSSAAVAGQLSVTRDPANTTNTSASLLVNPATSATNEFLFVAADNGTSRFTVDKEGDTATAGNSAVTGNATVGGTLAVTGTATLGATGTALTRVATFTAELSPAEVAANTCAEQTFTVTGIHASDIVFVNKPTAQAGLGVAGVRASATNTVGINFCNATGSPITPTAAQTYSFGAIR